MLNNSQRLLYFVYQVMFVCDYRSGTYQLTYTCPVCI